MSCKKISLTVLVVLQVTNCNGLLLGISFLLNEYQFNKLFIIILDDLWHVLCLR